METTHSGPLYIFRILSGKELSTLKLEVNLEDPESPWFWWPNHEGERGKLNEVYEKLEDKETQTKGVSLTYPITAYSRTLIIGDSAGGIILSAMPDEKGRITRINLKAPFQRRLFFTIKTGRSNWILTRYYGNHEDALDWIERVIEKIKWPVPPKVDPPGNFLLQVGLIGPDYDCMVPTDRGFSVLEDIAEVMKTYLGKNSWLHVFGYSHGHDILYPDYKPSSFLGGEEGLKTAIRKVHRKGQFVSFYLNIRIADQNLVDNDFELKSGILKDPLGKPIVEYHYERPFYVMDPNNQAWKDRLFYEAKRLVDLGADALELSHLGEQAFLLPLGEQWGAGILELLQRIRNLGVKIWYRGGADLYPADWLEISKEENEMDGDGHLRSGFFLGEHDPRLYTTVVPGRSFQIPLSRLKTIPFLREDQILKDLENIMGGLFIYNEEYMERIDMILKHAVQDERRAPVEAGRSGSEKSREDPSET